MAVAAAMLVGGLGGVLAESVPAGAATACGLNELDQNVFLVNDGLWSAPGNWSRNHLPASNEAVCVPGGVVAVVSSASTYLLAAQGGYTTTLRVEGTLRVQSGTTVNVTSAIYGASNLFNGGVIQVLNGSTLVMDPDQAGAPAFQNVVGGSLIQVSAGSKVFVRRPLTNTGTIDLTGGGQMVLDSAASAYSTGGTNGAVIGGSITMSAGKVTFGGNGALTVRATGGATTGTIGAAQALELGCVGYGQINWAAGLVNNGAIRFLPPLSGSCQMDYNLPGGSTFTNNGSMVFGSAGVVGNNGAPAYSSNFYNHDGPFVNGPTGTIVVHDHWSSLEPITNQGTITVAAGGFLDHPYHPLTNTGTLINGDRCDLGPVDNSGGTLELKKSCNVRGKATFSPTSTLRPHWSATELAKLVVAQSSPLAGTVNVVTDGVPPTSGVSRDLITGPVSGTFASVTSQSGAVGYTATYPGGKVQLTSGQGTGTDATDAIAAIVPARLLDTRGDGTTVDSLGLAAGVQAAGTTTEIQVTGRAGVPATATAAVLNLTVTDAQGPGFVTVWPCGSNRPTASSLNFVAGSTVPNGVISKIGTGGKVCVFVSNATQVLADIGGYFTDASPYRPLVPARLLDTRSGEATVDGVGQGGGPVTGGGTIEIQVTGRAGVPGDAAAAVLNITVTEAQGPGFVTVWPCGSSRPTASSLNFVAGSTVPNNVIAKIGAGGKVCLFASAGTHLLSDVNGFFIASAAFQAATPQRLLDTRPGESTVDGVGLGAGAAVSGATTEVQVTGRAGVPAGAVAAVVNVTVVDARGPGFVTVFPCGSDRPTASSLNFVAGSTVPNGVIAKIGVGGKVCLFASNGTHLIVDVNGTFTS